MIARLFKLLLRAYRSFIERSFLAGLTPNEQVAVWDALVSRDPFENAGKQLGVAFADAFQKQLDELRERLSALHPAGLDPGIVRPIETLRKLEKTIADANRPRITSLRVPRLVGVNLKLGKRPATHDPRDIRLSAIAAGITLPTPPSRFGHGTLFADWQMLGNDRVGDCVFAGGAHEVMLTNRLARRTVEFSDAAVLGDYAAVTGFNPADPTTDQGADVRTALGYRRSTGLADAHGTRHLIGAYVSLNAKNFDELMQAVYVFSAVGIGFEFPDSAMTQFNHGEPWDVVDGSPIEGGHYVPVVGRASRNIGTCVTWGRRQTFTRAFYEAFNDEAFAMVYPEELRNGKTERGFDLTQLNAALQSLR